MAKTEKQKKIDKAFRDYYKAESALIKLRDEFYPIGTKIRSHVLEITCTVGGGSYYPHQVATKEIGHMSWQHLEIINE